MNEVNNILEDRQQTYGDFHTQAIIAQRLKNSIADGIEASGASLTHAQREALDMIANKIGRIVNGDPNHIDSWDDIAGYATLVSRDIKRIQQLDDEYVE